MLVVSRGDRLDEHTRVGLGQVAGKRLFQSFGLWKLGLQKLSVEVGEVDKFMEFGVLLIEFSGSSVGERSVLGDLHVRQLETRKI